MFMKTENVHNTLDEAIKPQHVHDTNCKDEAINSPLSHNTFSMNERELQDLLKSPLFKNPKFNKREKILQSGNTTPTSKVDSQKKRQISTCSDNEFKSELYGIENFNGFEAIDMLHDLNSVVNDLEFDVLEDTKALDISLSIMMDANINSQETDDAMIDVNKDPPTDPLCISDREEKENDIKLGNSESNTPVRRKSIRLSNKQINYSNFFKKEEPKLNTIKKHHLLEELKDIEEQEELPSPLIEKLLKLHVKLIHKVPPQHKIELTGAHAPTREDKRLFQLHGPLRQGPYTPAEDKIIRQNWKTFCDLHDWDLKRVQPFLTWRHKGKYYMDKVQERQRFVQFLANKLPWRTLYSVYSRFKVLYNNKITHARYTKEEDKKILMYIKNKDLNKRHTKYVELAKLLKRTRISISKRYEYLTRTLHESKTKPLVNIRWTLPLIKKFIKTLLSVTLSEDVKELKYAALPKPVWQKMEEKLNIHENVLKTFWQHQLHLQLFSTGPIYLNDIKIQLIEYIYGKGISSTREIIWPNVARHFEGATAVFLCKSFYYLVQECDMNETDNFADVVEYLYHTKIPEIQEAPTDKFLPRIVYEKEEIYVLNENNEKDSITMDTDDDFDTEDFNSDDS